MWKQNRGMPISYLQLKAGTLTNVILGVSMGYQRSFGNRERDGIFRDAGKRLFF